MKRRTEEEVAVLKDLVRHSMSVDDIIKTGKLPNRTYLAIKRKTKRMVGWSPNNVEPIYSPPPLPKRPGA